MTTPVKSELELLKGRADQLGITYSAKIGVEALKTKIDNHMKNDTAVILDDLSAEQRKAKITEKIEKDSMKLIRCIIIPTDPLKNTLKGELKRVGNDYVSVHRMVPFNRETHVEQILLDLFKNAQRNHITHIKDHRTGTSIAKASRVPMYTVSILPPLSEEELTKLGRKQAARDAIEQDIEA